MTGTGLGRLCLAGLLLLSVAGCRRASSPASGEAAKSYFPMVQGARWVYELRSEMGTLRVTVIAKGEMPVRGQDGKLFVLDERNEGPSMGFVQSSPVGYVTDQGYIARVTSVDYDGTDRVRMLGEDSPTWLMPLDPKPGARWHQDNKMFTTPDGTGKQMGWSGEVHPRTALDVPAGHFEDVVEVHTSWTDPEVTGQDPTILYEDYYARGVGLLRSVTRDANGDPSKTIEMRLLEYQFPD